MKKPFKGKFGEKDFDKHLKAVKRKGEKIAVLQALVQTHEKSYPFDVDYVRGLRKRLRMAEVQMKAMG